MRKKKCLEEIIEARIKQLDELLLDTKTKRRWLVCYDSRSAIGQLNNVGVVSAETEQEAIEEGKRAMNTTADLLVYDLDRLDDGWCYWR